MASTFLVGRFEDRGEGLMVEGSGFGWSWDQCGWNGSWVRTAGGTS